MKAMKLVPRLGGLTLLVVLTSFLSACEPFDAQSYTSPAANPEYYHRAHKQLTDVIVHDIFSPPAASRNYLYPNIAAYEALVAANPKFRSFADQLNGLEPFRYELGDVFIDYELAALQAFLFTAPNFVFSQERMTQFREQLFKEIKSEVPRSVWNSTEAYAKAVSDHILAWAAKDQYKETRTFPKYSLMEEPWAWQPTPPSYMDGIEPSWNKIRTVVLDSAQQFRPKPPTAFSTDKNSAFYKEVMEVYEAVNQARAEHIEIAQFWDCNPYVSHHVGHVMYATKKITPGGHWMAITRLAAKQSGLPLMQTIEAYSMTSIGLFDGFISCWDEKWRSILIRPETYINRYIDEQWMPLLQTPPFPEHTSGHSVVSAASSEILTALFGEDFSFVDTTEEQFGLPARSFESFRQAAEEAAESRLFGGIHYRPAIDLGLLQGRQVATHILENIQTRTQTNAISNK